MSSNGCAQANWVWVEQSDIPHYIDLLFDEDDILGVIMVVLTYAREFPRKQMDFAAESMLGFVGVDLVPNPCLVFDPVSENLIYNTEELVAQYKTQAQEFLRDADRIEIIYTDSSFTRRAITCGLPPRKDPKHLKLKD